MNISVSQIAAAMLDLSCLRHYLWGDDAGHGIGGRDGV